MTLTRSSTSPQTPPIMIDGEQICQLQHLKILGVLFSQDLRWNMHFEYIFTKSCRSMAIVKKVWQSNCGGDVIWAAYQGLVNCHVAYCWPVICDLPEKHLAKLKKLERTVCRWAGRPAVGDLRSRLDKACIRLIQRLAADCQNHPLASHFHIRDVTPSLHHQRRLEGPASRSSLLNNTFFKFCVYT